MCRGGFKTGKPVHLVTGRRRHDHAKMAFAGRRSGDAAKPVLIFFINEGGGDVSADKAVMFHHGR